VSEIIDDLERSVTEAASAGRIDDASAALQALLKMQLDQRQAAVSLLRIVRDGRLPIEMSLTVLAEIEARYPRDIDSYRCLATAWSWHARLTS